MPAVRASAILVALAVVGAWAGDAATTDRHPPTLRMAATTTTVAPPAAPPPTTTTTAPETPRKASRSLRRPITPPGPFAGCDGWQSRTRQQSDACWRDSMSRWSDWPVETMLAIVFCESRGNAWAVNASGHVGLLQIAGGWATKGDGPANIAWGHDMFMRSGLRPWRQCW